MDICWINVILHNDINLNGLKVIILIAAIKDIVLGLLNWRQHLEQCPFSKYSSRWYLFNPQFLCSTRNAYTLCYLDGQGAFLKEMP